jgi:soluble lytic murein transglycosylase
MLAVASLDKRKSLRAVLACSWLVHGMFLAGSAMAYPVAFDFPDAQQLSIPLAEQELEVARSERISALENHFPASSQLVIALEKYRAPSELVVLREVGLDASPEVDVAVAKAMAWLRRELTPSDRETFSATCDQKFTQVSKSLQLTADALACVPWAMEKLDQVVIQGAGERRGKASLRGRVRSETEWREELKDVDYYSAFWRLDPQNIEELKKESLIAKVVAKDCRYRGSIAALIARAEAFFPEADAYDVVDKLYPDYFQCGEPDDDGFERTHLRTGLLHLMRGDAVKAKQSFLLASYAENADEEFRSLFWLGVIEENSSARSPEQVGNEFWDQLRMRYPLTIHAVVAGHSVGQDPLSNAVASKESIVARRVGLAWSEFNLAAFFFELLIARKEASHLADFARFAARIVDAPNPEAMLFLSKCFDTARLYRTAIGKISRYLRDTQSQGLTLETMNLLFPRAYTDQIFDSAGNVDPVIVLSLIRQESAFDPMARSVADARGLMQLLPSTAARWLANARQELYDPSANVRTGVKYMETLFKRYDGNVEHVLAAYNAGLKNLDKWKQRFPEANTLMFMDFIPFRETRTYVAIILRNAYWYGRLMALQQDETADVLVRKSSQAKWRSNTIHNLLSIAWSKGRNKESRKSALSQLYALPSSDAVPRSE